MKDDKKALDDDERLTNVLGEKFATGELVVKDLGPQVGWQTVYLIEYVSIHRLCHVYYGANDGADWTFAYPSIVLSLPTTMVRKSRGA